MRHRLVIEADGPFHDPERDAVRDAWLAAKGFRVLRFPNTEIQLKDWQVIGRILKIVGTPPLQPYGGTTPHPTAFGGHLLPQGAKGHRVKFRRQSGMTQRSHKRRRAAVAFVDKV